MRDAIELMADVVADDALLARAAAGDKDAVEALIRRYIDFVYATATRRCGDRHLADDVTQGVFITFVAKARRLPRGVVLIGWLQQTTMHLSANTLKRSARRRHHETRAAMNKPEVVTPSDADRADQLARLDAAIARLRRVSREAILLRFFRRASLRDVGAALGISEEAAKKRVARAVDELRTELRLQAADDAAVTSVLTAAFAMPGAPAGLTSSIVNVAATSTSSGAFSLALQGVFAMAKVQYAASIALLLLVAGGGAIAIGRVRSHRIVASTPTTAPTIASAALPTVADTLIGSVWPVSAEMIGMTSHPVRKQANAREVWWSPSGAPLARPYHGETLPPTWDLGDLPLKIGVDHVLEFAFKIDLGNSNGSPVTMRWNQSSVNLYMSSAPHRPYGVPGDDRYVPDDRAFRFFIAAAPPAVQANPATVRLDVATGPWVAIASATPNADGTPFTDKAGAVKFELQKKVDEWPAPGFQATWSHASDRDLRIIAIDRDGKEWPLARQWITDQVSPEGTMTISSRAEKPIDVISLRLEGRPYSAKIEFLEIALKSGMNTSASVRAQKQDDSLGNLP